MDKWIEECEQSLCLSINQRGGFDAYLAALAPKDCGGQCTAIWPAGALAYRCRTCQLTSSSAVCVSCFKAGGHEDHDWIQYRSASGGCCDCGDLSAWRAEGCCPAHQPGRRVVPLEQLLRPEPRMLLEAVLEAALARLSECLGQCTGPQCSAAQRRDAQLLCVWLQRFASLAPVRRPMSDALRRALHEQPLQEQGREVAEVKALQQSLDFLGETTSVLQEQKLMWQQQDQQLQVLQERLQGHIDRLQQVRQQEGQRMQLLVGMQQSLRELSEGAGSDPGDPAGDPAATLGGSSLHVREVMASATPAVATSAAGESKPGAKDIAARAVAVALPRAAAGSLPPTVETAATAAKPNFNAAAAATAATEASAIAAAAMSELSSLSAVSLVPVALSTKVYQAQARGIISRLSRLHLQPQPQPLGAGPGSHADGDSLLRRWVLGLRWLHPDLLHHLTSLLLLLLYETDFKYDMAVHLMDCYANMLSAIGGLAPSQQAPAGDGGGSSGSGRHPLCGVLDRLVVQLFNSEEVTTRLVSERNVMEQHLAVLSYLTGAFIDELHGAAGRGAAAASGDASPMRGWEADLDSEQRLNAILDAMRRLASDFSTLVHHVPVAHYLLSNGQLWGEVFLGGLVRPLQAMLPHRRKVSGDIEERAKFRVPLACSAEFVVTACVAELLTTVTGLRPAAAAARSSGGGSAPWGSRAGSGGGTDEERVKVLYGAARQAFEACEEWCSDRLARSGARGVTSPTQGAAAGGGSGPSPRRLSVAADLYEGLLAGELEASPHLPLHRTASAFVQALLQLEQEGGPIGQLARSHVEQLLSMQASLDEGSAWRPVNRFLLLGQAFVSQIIARRWLRNGEDVSQVELFVLNGRELTDLDVLMTQCWMAAEDPDVVLYDTLSATGAKPLLAAAGVPAPGPSAGGGSSRTQTPAPAELQDPTSAAACSEALRWLVSLLRERNVTGLDPGERLRSTLVQWLALRDWTYNQLHELLPQDLQQQSHMEQVLAEVATYRAASLSQARHYSLRREAWDLFCPAFIHYTPSMRSRAWEAAMAARKPLGGAAGSGGKGGGGDAVNVVYQPHWQLRRPRHPLPGSLEPMQRVLETPGLWRLVAWVLQACMSGAPRLPEDTLLGALNLLALQLHRLEDLLGRMPPNGHGKQNPPLDQHQHQHQQHQQHHTSADSPKLTPAPGHGEELSRLRTSISVGATALTGAARPAAITGNNTHIRNQHGHPDDKQLYLQHDQDSNHQPESNRRLIGTASLLGTGIVSLLAALLHSQTPTPASIAPLAPAAGPAPVVVQLSSETVDCLQWLHQTATRLVLAAEAVGVLETVPRAGATAEAGTSAASTEAGEQAVLDAFTCTGSGGGPASGTAEAVEAEAARRRELARQRQAAMMAKLRAQQEAFLKRATVQDAVASDSSDEDEDAECRATTQSDDEEEEHGKNEEDMQEWIAAGSGAGPSTGGEAAVPSDEGNEHSEGSEGSEDIRGVSPGDAGWMSSSLSDEGGDEGGHGSGVVRLGGRRSNAVGISGGRRRRGCHRGRSPGAATAGPSQAAVGATRQQLPLGRWLPVDLPDPSCAVCREGTAGGRHGPLAYIAHTAMCFCTAAPLRPGRAWDDDPSTQSSETLASLPAAAWPAATAAADEEQGDAPADRQAPAEDDDLERAGCAAAGDLIRPGSAAQDMWLQAWRSGGPAVCETDLGGGPHVHCCGHVIHTQCFARFVAGQLRQYLSGAHFPGSHLVMPEMSEFLCPVCRRLANGIVPAAPFQWRQPRAAAAVTRRRTACSQTLRTRLRRKMRTRTASGLNLAITAAPPVPSGSDLDASRGSGPHTSSIVISDSCLPLARDDDPSSRPGDGCDRQVVVGGVGCGSGATDAINAASEQDGGIEDWPMADAEAAAGTEAGTGSRAMQGSPFPPLPPLGHVAGLGALQGLMDSLELCASGPKDTATVVEAGRSGAKGPAAQCVEPGRGPGLGNRGCVFERIFGTYGEVANMATHQMLREGITHMAQLERALEARARLLQLRNPPDAAASNASHNPALPPADPEPRAEASPGIIMEQQQHTQQRGEEAQHEHASTTDHPLQEPTNVLFTSGGAANDGAYASGQVMAEGQPAAAAEAAAAATAPVVVTSRSTWPWRWQVAVPVGWRLPPAPKPKLAGYCSRLTDALAVWKGLSPHTRLWAALAHNLAHFEAVRRPIVLARGVLGGPEAAAAIVGGADGGSGTGVAHSVTGLLAVEAAHWRAIAALTAMAVCGGVRHGSIIGGDAAASGSATPGGRAASASASGIPSRLAADAAAASSLLRDPTNPPTHPPGARHSHSNFQSHQHYPQQPNPQLQPVLAVFHNQLRWLLCELETMGVSRSPPPAPPQAPGITTTVAGEEQQQQQLGPQQQSGVVGSAAGCTAELGEDLLEPPPPAASLDWTCAFLRPYLPEIVVPRLAASLVGSDLPSLRSRRSTHPHKSTYLLALSFRRLTGLDDLTADPLLLTLELLGAGLSGLAGASLVPGAKTTASGVAAADTAELGEWLPGSPQQLLRTVLRLVWPIQVVQAGIWRAATAPPEGADCASAAASAPPRPSSAPLATESGCEDLDFVRLVNLYGAALSELGAQQERGQARQSQGRVHHGVGAAGSSGPGLALGSLSSALLPFLVRVYALDCALGHQTPDAALMSAYASLPLPLSSATGQYRHNLHHDKQYRQRHNAAASGSAYTTAPAASTAVGASARVEGAVPLTEASTHEPAVLTSSRSVPDAAGLATTEMEVETPGEAAAPEEADLRAAASAAALVGHLVAALGLSDVVDALREPLLLSRRRASEVVAAAARYTAEADDKGAASPSASGSGELPPQQQQQQQQQQSHHTPPSDLQDALLARVLARWCGARVLAVMVDPAAKAQNGQTGAGPADPVGGATAAAATPAAAGAADVVALPARPQLTWYRGLPPPPSLIPLPYLFQSLFLHFAEARCPDCGAKPDNPALCLLTGRFVCN
ncbi:hypothetical protein Vafri_2876, partial [Volvox africanus]